MNIACKASRIFTGEAWLENQVVVIKDGIIHSLEPRNNESGELRDFDNKIICPAFLDLQIYGAAGRLFSQYPSPGSLQALYDHNLASGTMACFPTVATNSREVVHSCIDAVRKYWEGGGKGILGLHLEGPWINPVKKGAHLASYIQSPDVRSVKELLEYGKGVIKIITLAPEMVDPTIPELLHSSGILVSAGHSNATYQQAISSFNNGIPTATHLYNAMSPLQHRSPGMVGAIFDHPQVMSSIIPDGIHCDFAAVSIAKKIMKERLFVITDAVTSCTEGPYQHSFAGDHYVANGVLSGSALTMLSAVKNLVTRVHLPLSEALRMCSLYPARIAGLSKSFGSIQPGMPANLVAIDLENDEVEIIQ